MLGLITCSGSNISPEEAKKLGIYLVPLQINIDGKSYRDQEEISLKKIYKIIREGKCPKTAAILIEDLVKVVKKMKADLIDEAIVLPLCRAFSSTIETMCLGLKEVNIKPYPVDCYVTSLPQKMFVLQAKKLIDEGFTADVIVKKLKKAIKDTDTLIVANDLNYLKRGGRITPAAAKLGSIMGIKPILRLHYSLNGKIDTFAKVRTKKKAIKYMVNYLLENYSLKDHYFLICHSDDFQSKKEIENYIKKIDKEAKIISDQFASVIVCHTGIGCVGVGMLPIITDVD